MDVITNAVTRMKLRYLQKELEAIYGIEVDYSVEDFLITDANLARQLDTSCNPREVKEKLLIRQSGGDLDITLYLDETVLEHLGNENPLVGLNDGNINDFWVALEGVSHFLYLIWNAPLQKSITLLELEMQAEIDKYIASFCLLGKQNRSVVSHRIREFLFCRTAFDKDLDRQSLSRYKDASFFAGKYCMQLEREYLQDWRRPNWHDEIRYFYRLPQSEKIRRIQSGSVVANNH